LASSQCSANSCVAPAESARITISMLSISSTGGSAQAPGRSPSCDRRRYPSRRSPAGASRRALPGSRPRTRAAVEPVPMLVVPGRLLLLRMRGDQRRVHVDRQPLRRTIKLPEPRPRPATRVPDSVQQPRRGGDPLRPSRTRSSQTPPSRTAGPDHGSRPSQTRTRRRRRASPRDRRSPSPGHDRDAAARPPPDAPTTRS
jgi:hypothetical protein